MSKSNQQVRDCARMWTWVYEILKFVFLPRPWAISNQGFDTLTSVSQYSSSWLWGLRFSPSGAIKSMSLVLKVAYSSPPPLSWNIRKICLPVLYYTPHTYTPLNAWGQSVGTPPLCLLFSSNNNHMASTKQKSDLRSNCSITWGMRRMDKAPSKGSATMLQQLWGRKHFWSQSQSSCRVFS